MSVSVSACTPEFVLLVVMLLLVVVVVVVVVLLLLVWLFRLDSCFMESTKYFEACG